jgi:hypothetical protein
VYSSLVRSSRRPDCRRLDDYFSCLPRELPSVEEALKMLAGALETACEPGLDALEIQRLQVLATLATTYEISAARGGKAVSEAF